MTTFKANASAPVLRSRVIPAMAVAVLACGGGDGAVPSDLDERISGGVIPSPAGDRSGEPFLASAGEGVWMSWIQEHGEAQRVVASYFEAEWSPAVTIAEGDDFFVNWADFPSVQPVGDALVAHWLQRAGQGTYDYGVRLAWSRDGGRSWSEPWTPHGDGTPTEHGFVSVFGTDEDAYVAWLDGRAMVDGGSMALRARPLPFAAEGGSDEEVLDGRTCECCQTAAAVVDGIPIVAYRDRSDDEVRNIHVTRRVDGQWTEGVPLHDDGWVIGGCPVNGPAMDGGGGDVVIAWFTAPNDRPTVNVAFSADAGASFGPPVRVDAGQPGGRVDVIRLDDGSALVSWLEREGGGGSVLSRRVLPEGTALPLVPLVATSDERASGFPRLARLGQDRVMLAWTDVSGEGQVRVAVYDLTKWEDVS